MAAIEFIMGGGMASVGGDLSEDERTPINNIVKRYGEKIVTLGRKNSIPASEIGIFRMSSLFVCKDIANYHFLFVDKAGMNQIMYSDLTKHGFIALQDLEQKIRIEVGEVHWAFSITIAMSGNVPDVKIEELANQYIEVIINARNNHQDNKISDETIMVPELTKFMDAFKRDYPKEQKTAFIIMQFSKTKLHDQIAQTIKDTLKKHNIIGLRADDKEYSDDLFHNIRTYMHCADFGISVFERILDNNFNPNVSLEVGYMMGIGKNVCLLKDQTLTNLQTDLIGKLYKPFDLQDVEDTLPKQLEKWLKDKGLV